MVVEIQSVLLSLKLAH
jgi:hypothetical protein